MSEQEGRELARRAFSTTGGAALLAELERGWARRDAQQAAEPSLAAESRAEPAAHGDGYTWCIACQSMVPYPEWGEHVEHSQAALHG